jgi:CRISPR-associated endonuclease Csy4
MNHLWEKIFPQVHLALVGLDADDAGKVGISWPNYRFDDNRRSIGNKLRLFAEKKEQLESLNLISLLERLSDYVHVRSVAAVPENVRFGYFYRINIGESRNKLAKRYAKRHDTTEESALKRYPVDNRIRRKEPFIRLQSMSSGDKFKLIIGFKDEPAEVKGSYNKSYGLSFAGTPATVPIF